MSFLAASGRNSVSRAQALAVYSCPATMCLRKRDMCVMLSSPVQPSRAEMDVSTCDDEQESWASGS